MKLIIFEDGNFENLYPLTYLRPVFELKTGFDSLREKILRTVQADEVAYFTRDCFTATLGAKYGAPVNDLAALDGELALVNGAALLLEGGARPAFKDDALAVDGDTVVFGKLTSETVAALPKDGFEGFLKAAREKATTAPTDVKLMKYGWDFILENHHALEADFKAAGKSGVEGELSPHAAIYGDEKNVYIAKGASVHPFAALDCTGGPIYIDEDALILPHTRVEGPAYIGPKAQLHGGKIRECCTIGPMCRVGGEVEETIIHGYSNKYHDGFLGHAYVCKWVNLGALTTNSDLKNDYSSVSVYVGGKLVDTGSTKVGSLIGDHSKTSIGTLFNTGSVVSVMCNVVGAGDFAPKYLPSFTWFANGLLTKGLGFKNFVETAKTAMGRRDIELTEDEMALLKHVHTLTNDERRAKIKAQKKLRL